MFFCYQPYYRICPKSDRCKGKLPGLLRNLSKRLLQKQQETIPAHYSLIKTINDFLGESSALLRLYETLDSQESCLRASLNCIQEETFLLNFGSSIESRIKETQYQSCSVILQDIREKYLSAQRKIIP